jgi:hypothetical protein
MKKTIVFLVFTIFSIGTILCQVDTLKKNRKSFNLGICVMGTIDNAMFDGLAYTKIFRKDAEKWLYYSLDPSLVFSVKKHSFSLGPKIFILHDGSYNGNEKAFGGQFNYQYTFRKPDKSFNYFTFYNLAFVQTSRTLEGYGSEPPYSTFYFISRHYENHFNNEIGLGVLYSFINSFYQYKFFQGFYIMASLSAGVDLFQRNSKLSCPDLPDNSSFNYLQKGDYLSSGQLTGFIRGGIGYNFLRHK